VVVENPDHPPGNAILFVDHQKRLWLVWCRMESTRPIRRGSGWDRCRLMYRISGDDGETWSDDKKLVEDDLWAVPRNVPVTLRSGRLVLPLEASVDNVEGSIFLVTDDDGKNWKRSHFIPHGSQPTLAQRKDGTLVAFLRQAPKIHQLESKDEGLTWTKPQPTELNNPDAGIAMTPLQNGHWLMVFNDTPIQRTPLSITRSQDEGKTWEKPLHLESNPGEYSYPCIIQTTDGKIELTYTFRRYAIKHVEMNEDWISHLTRPN
jgi:predicted neuraminidase